MTNQDQGLFYDSIVIICMVMTIFNSARFKSRGLSAVLLAVAFFIMGLTVYAYSLHAPMYWMYIGGTLVFLALIGDIVYRMGRPPSGGKP